MLLKLSLCVITVIQLTSSQSTSDNDFSSCGRTDDVVSHLLGVVSQMQQALGQLLSSVSQLQSDVDELKNELRRTGTVFTYVSSKHSCLHRNLTA